MQQGCSKLRSGSQKQGSWRFCLGRGAFSRLDIWRGWELMEDDVVLGSGLGSSPAHSTALMCTTSGGRAMGRLTMDLD